MLPRRRGRTPTRIASRLTRQRQITRAMNDLHRAAQPTWLTTGASTQLQLPSGRKPDSPSRCQPRPATLPPSQSHLQQSRDCPIAEERRWVSFAGAENAQNVRVNRAADRKAWPQDPRSRRLRFTALFDGVFPSGCPAQSGAAWGLGVKSVKSAIRMSLSFFRRNNSPPLEKMIRSS